MYVSVCVIVFVCLDRYVHVCVSVCVYGSKLVYVCLHEHVHLCMDACGGQVALVSVLSQQPPSPKCWDYRSMPPNLVSIYILCLPHILFSCFYFHVYLSYWLCDS